MCELMEIWPLFLATKGIKRNELLGIINEEHCNHLFFLQETEILKFVGDDLVD